MPALCWGLDVRQGTRTEPLPSWGRPSGEIVRISVMTYKWKPQEGAKGKVASYLLSLDQLGKQSLTDTEVFAAGLTAS